MRTLACTALVLLHVFSSSVLFSQAPAIPTPTGSVPSQVATQPSPQQSNQIAGQLQVSKEEAACRTVLTAITRLEKKFKPESTFRKVRDDYVSNMIWEFLGYHRNKGGWIPLLITILSLATAIIKAIFLFKKQDVKETKKYKVLDGVASVAFLLLTALIAYVVFGGRPVMEPADGVDLVPLENQISRLEENTQRLLATQAVIEPAQLAEFASTVANSCREAQQSNSRSIQALHSEVRELHESSPGYVAWFFSFLFIVAAAVAAVWLLGHALGWW